MSLESTKKQLIHLLEDEDNKVIALSGKWGTGKSFMWEKVKENSGNEKVKKALYASLFGVSSVDQIRLKLLQSDLGAVEMWPALSKTISQAWHAAVKLAEQIIPGAASINNLAHIAAPAILRNRVLVLDDIERKHANLHINEILGFIDEFTKQHKSRVILILNDDQLEKREIWDTLREKVIDQEIRLTISTSEAFEIGLGIIPSQWADQIKPSLERCEVTNIRIVCKVIKVVNSILGGHDGLSESVLSRVIPSTVLLSAIHYKGIENGPDFAFVLSNRADIDWDEFLEPKEEETEEKHKSKWKRLLNQLGIIYCDEYELLVVEFLQSGMCDDTDLAAVIARYIKEEDEMAARNQCNKFLERAVWEHRLTEAQLLEEAKPVVNKAHLIDRHTVSVLHETITELGAPELADLAIANWIKAFKDKNLKDVDVDDPFFRKIHPSIAAELEAINTKGQASITVLDACKHIAINSGWGPRQETALRSAKFEDFEKTIRNADSYDLRIVMAKMLEMCSQKGSYVHHFGSAADNFTEACRRIVNDLNSPRLAKLVRLLFSDARISALLDNPPQQLEQDAKEISSPDETQVLSD